jgi:succinate dehydrogenase flavin-adding protein (antitoxin of CptAB toxin-antitoxin module)
MLEGDLLLATFARERLGTMEEAQVREFDQVRSPSSCLDWAGTGTR